MSRKIIVNGQSLCYLPPTDASEIRYDMGGGNYSNVQTELDGKVSKSGDTMSGTLAIEAENSSTSMVTSQINLGNNKATGTEGNSAGAIALFADSQYCSYMVARNLTADRVIYFPDKAGTICLLESLTTGMLSQSIDVTVGHTETTTIDWTGVDKSKVLYSWVWWSNSLDDVPTFLTPYYNGTYTPVVNVVHHQWKTEQRVNLKICYILKG